MELILDQGEPAGDALGACLRVERPGLVEQDLAAADRDEERSQPFEIAAQR
jgi:hypothetical protein